MSEITSEILDEVQTAGNTETAEAAGDLSHTLEGDPPSSPPSNTSSRRAQVKPPSLQALPNYAKSLLKIKVPVVVTLAEKKQPLGQIIEMGPGMIIQFDKSCEEMLQLEVGQHKIAAGEAVKVGDKFGLRVTSMILPDERFKPVKPQKPSS